jgi:hypothetical protein
MSIELGSGGIQDAESCCYPTTDDMRLFAFPRARPGEPGT